MWGDFIFKDILCYIKSLICFFVIFIAIVFLLLYSESYANSLPQVSAQTNKTVCFFKLNIRLKEESKHLGSRFVEMKHNHDVLLETVEELQQSAFLYDEELTILNDMQAQLLNSLSIMKLPEFEGTVQEFTALKDEREAAYLAEQERLQEESTVNNNINTSNSGNYNSGSFQSQGVIMYNGMRYTYYSSNVLYHYRTPEWTAGGDGIYRDAAGYIVVASSDYGQGTVVDTPFGAGKVYDSGAPSGTIDIYTNF